MKLALSATEILHTSFYGARPCVHTGSPHIRLEQTTFIGRLLRFVPAIFLIRARNARSVIARSGTEITKSLGACSEI